MKENLRIPYRILTERLTLRPWNPEDASRVNLAVAQSLEHLRPWMPWTKFEPQTPHEKAEVLRRMRGQFDLDQQYIYGVLSRDESLVLGSTGLHTRVGPDALEIGYWIHVDHIGKGLATELTMALTKVAFEIHGVNRVEIQCDPANVASAAIPHKLGYTHEATLRERSEDTDGNPRDTMIWSLFATDYPATPSKTAAIQVFDAIGEEIVINS